MNRQLDVEQLLDMWLDDGPTDTADAVFDETVARIYRQRQRPAWRFLRREPTVTTPIKTLIAAAAVIAVALVGGAILLGRPGGVGDQPSPSAPPVTTPSPVTPASPSTAPSASAVFPPWYATPGDGAGILTAGSHATRRWIAGSTFAVPEDWVNDGDNAQIYTLFPNTPANEAEYALAGQTAQNILLAATVANNMFAICDATGLFEGATAAEVIDAVVANEAFSTTEPVDVTIGGLSGQQVDVRLDRGWTGSCPLQENDPPTRDYGDARNRVIVLDAPGRGLIGISVGSTYSSDFQGLLTEAMPIVESFEFDLSN